MLVRNCGISANGIGANEAMSNKSVKRPREAIVEGHVMNDESADANSFINCDRDFQPNSIGKTIVSGDMIERQLLQRSKRMRANSSVRDQGDSSEAGSPEVIFLRSCRPSQRYHSSSCDVKVDDHTPIDVDSLEYPINETVNLEESNKETSARARQIEEDEILARQLQEEFAGEELKGGLQQDGPILLSMVQREIRAIAASDADSSPVFTGLPNRSNCRISPNGIATNEAMSKKSAKRLREASVEEDVMNDESADANSFINCDRDFQPNSIGKAIVSGDMIERQLLQRSKRMRVNSSSSAEANRFSVCRNSTSPPPSGSSDFATQIRSQACRNDVFFNGSKDDASERNIKYSRKSQGWSRLHPNERQLARLDKTRGGVSSLSSVGDQGNSSQAGSPEVIFLRSCRPSQRHPSTSITSNVVQESSCDGKVDDHTPIDVDSLEYPINETVNLEESNKEASARARQIEEDEILARQLQEEFAGEELEGGLHQDGPILHSMVEREIREHIAASDSDSSSVFTGLPVSFGIGERREPSHSLTIRPSLPPFVASHPTVPPHRRRDAVSARWHRSSGRPFHGSRFQFPSHTNIEMRVDMEHAIESNVTHRFLAGVQRDFNENDYEMLLALDDDNNNWKGASQRHIDRLPVSTVQNDISDEVCTVCLEMPKSGEVIRHLLCMHKFHKECIDPWLAKQASCPVCKLSV